MPFLADGASSDLALPDEAVDLALPDEAVSIGGRTVTEQQVLDIIIQKWPYGVFTENGREMIHLYMSRLGDADYKLAFNPLVLYKQAEWTLRDGWAHAWAHAEVVADTPEEIMAFLTMAMIKHDWELDYNP